MANCLKFCPWSYIGHRGRLDYGRSGFLLRALFLIFLINLVLKLNNPSLEIELFFYRKDSYLFNRSYFWNSCPANYVVPCLPVVVFRQLSSVSFPSNWGENRRERVAHMGNTPNWGGQRKRHQQSWVEIWNYHLKNLKLRLHENTDHNADGEETTN